MTVSNSLVFALICFATLGSGLMGGLFFAFSNFVMKSLGRLPANNGIAAMQAINVTVLNPLFLALFMGTAAGCLMIAVLAFLRWERPGSTYLLAGSVLYFAGCFLVTIICNVPRNNALAAVDPTSANGESVWQDYLVNWTKWNHVRTVASLAAAASFVLALSAH